MARLPAVEPSPDQFEAAGRAGAGQRVQEQTFVDASTWLGTGPTANQPAAHGALTPWLLTAPLPVLKYGAAWAIEISNLARVGASNHQLNRWARWILAVNPFDRPSPLTPRRRRYYTMRSGTCPRYLNDRRVLRAQSPNHVHSGNRVLLHL